MALKCSQNVSVRQLHNMGCCVYVTSLNFIHWETGLSVSLPRAITLCLLLDQALTCLLFHSIIAIDIISPTLKMRNPRHRKFK